MCVNEEQAQAFLKVAALHREQLTSYAKSFTKCDDAAHDLFQDALIKCHDRIQSNGFFGASYVPYLVSAIKYNFYYAKREAPQTVSLSALKVDAPQPEDDAERQALDALTVAIHQFVASHYSMEQAAVFELHVNGLTLSEIAFSTDYSRYKACRLLQRIKKNIKANFRL